MAKSGRKRKAMGKAKRNQKTAEGQGRTVKQKATPERLAHFKAATGRKRANNMDNEDASVIHMLYGARIINEAQKSVSLDYASLYDDFKAVDFGRDVAVNFAKQLGGGGTVAMPSEVIDEYTERKLLKFKALSNALTAPQRTVVNYVVIDDLMPGFYIKQRNKEVFTVDDVNQLALLLSGLNALIGKE